MQTTQDFQCYEVIRWLKEAQAAFQTNKDYPIEQLSAFLFEFCKIFKQMGRLMGIAFSDVNEKVEIMRLRNKQYGDLGLYAVIQIEIQKSIINMNGENNKKYPHGDKQYVSIGRSLLRMMRFINFLEVMFSEINSDRAQKVSDACSKAYNLALKPYHPFLIRSAAKLAMSAAPDRARMLALFLPNRDEQEAYVAIVEFLSALEPIRLELWKYYETNNLTDLQ